MKSGTMGTQRAHAKRKRRRHAQLAARAECTGPRPGRRRRCPARCGCNTRDKSPWPRSAPPVGWCAAIRAPRRSSSSCTLRLTVVLGRPSARGGDKLPCSTTLANTSNWLRSACDISPPRQRKHGDYPINRTMFPIFCRFIPPCGRRRRVWASCLDAWLSCAMCFLCLAAAAGALCLTACAGPTRWPCCHPAASLSGPLAPGSGGVALARGGAHVRPPAGRLDQRALASAPSMQFSAGAAASGGGGGRTMAPPLLPGAALNADVTRQL